MLTTSRVMTTFCGSALRARTTATFSVDPGAPASKLRISGSDISRVLWPSIDSKISVCSMPAFSAGDPGNTATTAA